MKKLSSSSPIVFVPSKTFLWGEYSALASGHAGVVATEPCFAFSDSEILLDSKVVSQEFRFHPQSPAGKFITYVKEKIKLSQDQAHALYQCHLYDPHRGAGGFGRSTAEWVYVSQKLSERIDMDTQTLWELYREIVPSQSHETMEEVLPPSGYDLVTQLKPSFNLIHILAGQLRVTEKPWPFTRLSFLIFKTKKKVFTHDHIASLSTESLKPLTTLSEKVNDQYIQEDQDGFLAALKAFRIHLESSKLICAETLDIVARLEFLKDVIFAKGCGALGADVVAVFCKKQYKNQVLESINQTLADELRFVADEESVIFGG